MKIGSKALSLVLALAMIVGTFSGTAVFAAESQVWDSNFDSGSIHYHVTDSNFIDKDSGSVEVTYVDSGFDSYEIPQQVTYQDSNYNVTAISSEAFDKTQAQEINAVIKDSSISLSVETAATGYVSLAAVEDGDVTAKAIPAAGYQFDGWYQPQVETRISSASSLSLTETTGYALIAKFTPVTFISDTNYDFAVKGTYQIKITSKDGRVPTFAVGSAGVFHASLVAKIGNDYYYKLTVAGPIGAKAGIYVNGTKLLVATVGSQIPTFTSDTNQDFTVMSAYQIKITSINGKIPSFAVGTTGVFTPQFIKKSGNDYFFKLTAIGQTGEKAGVYVNGVKLLTATVGTSANSVTSDTHGSFNVKAGASYTFKLTASKKPVFVTGSSSVFKVVLANTVGNNYFFKVTAVGKAGASTGFYINSGKTPIAVATVK
jgi:predicted transcriptional regulator